MKEKCLFHFQSWSCDGSYFVDWRRIYIVHPTVSPDGVHHSQHPHLHWVEKLRHNTQKVPATLPSVSHARLESSVAACWWATARDRDKDGRRQRGGRGWVEVALGSYASRRCVSHRRHVLFYDSDEDEYIFVAWCQSLFREKTTKTTKKS